MTRNVTGKMSRLGGWWGRREMATPTPASRIRRAFQGARGQNWIFKDLNHSKTFTNKDIDRKGLCLASNLSASCRTVPATRAPRRRERLATSVEDRQRRGQRRSVTLQRRCGFCRNFRVRTMRRVSSLWRRTATETSQRNVLAASDVRRVSKAIN